MGGVNTRSQMHAPGRARYTSAAGARLLGELGEVRLDVLLLQRDLHELRVHVGVAISNGGDRIGVGKQRQKVDGGQSAEVPRARALAAAAWQEERLTTDVVGEPCWRRP